MITKEEFEKALDICLAYQIQVNSIANDVNNSVQKIRLVTHKGLLSKIDKDAKIENFRLCSRKLRIAIHTYSQYEDIEIKTVADIIKIHPERLSKYRAVGKLTVKELKEFQRALLVV